MKVKVKNSPRYERLLKARKQKQKNLSENKQFKEALDAVNEYIAKELEE